MRRGRLWWDILSVVRAWDVMENGPSWITKRTHIHRGPKGSFGHVVSRPVAEYVATHKDTLFNYQGEDVSVGIWLDESPLKDQIVWKSTTHFANHGNCKDPNLWMIGHDITSPTMKACFARKSGRRGNTVSTHLKRKGDGGMRAKHAFIHLKAPT